MCKAFEDMKLEGIELGLEQGRELGLEEGRELGQEQGARLMGQLSFRLAKDGKVEEIARASMDASYRNQLLISYGMLSEAREKN